MTSGDAPTLRDCSTCPVGFLRDGWETIPPDVLATVLDAAAGAIAGARLALDQAEAFVHAQQEALAARRTTEVDVDDDIDIGAAESA